MILQEHCYRDAIEKHGPFEVALHLTNDRNIAQLNESFLAKKGATDVLSFPLIAFPHGPGSSALRNKARKAAEVLEAWPRPAAHISLGDIVISYPSCKRNAKMQKGKKPRKESIREEFLRLIIHAILHLFGYDHEKSGKDRILMEKREEEMFLYIMQTCCSCKGRKIEALF